MESKNIIRAVLVGGAFCFGAFSALPASAATSGPSPLHSLKMAVFDDAAPDATPDAAPADPTPDPAADPAPAPDSGN